MIGRNRTFAVMASAVEAALEEVRDAEQAVKDAEAELARRRADRSNAQSVLERVRDELFAAHPELAPTTPAQAGRAPESGLAFQPVEVDDENDIPDFREMP